MLTPRTEEKFNKINEEFDQMMKKNLIQPVSIKIHIAYLIIILNISAFLLTILTDEIPQLEIRLKTLLKLMFHPVLHHLSLTVIRFKL